MRFNLYTRDTINVSDILKNPNTWGQAYILILFLILLISITAYVLLRKKKYTKFMILIVGSVIIIPMSVYALCKCDIEIESKIKILNMYNGEIYRYSTAEIELNENLENFKELKSEINEFTDEKDYVKNRNLINSDFYIKHIIKNNVIIDSYLCLSADKEYCFTGNYTTDEQILAELENYATRQSGICSFTGRPSYCNYDNIRAESWNINSSTIQYSTILFCGINEEGKTACFYD